MTRFDQLKASFPEHWRTIVERMAPNWRCAYLPAPSSGSGEATLSGAFVWEQTPEGHRFWVGVARGAK